MSVDLIQLILSFFSGILVGFSLGLIGGGGSILAIPLLIYFVGYDHPHIAIGTTALAVGINAFLNLIPHTRAGHVNYRIGAMFSLTGIAGVIIGAELGLLTPGGKLLFIFAAMMLFISAIMFRRSLNIKSEQASKNKERKTTSRSTVKIMLSGLGVGFMSGYFGIGGGFLIVPALMLSSGLEIINAIGTSLISVGTFGIVTTLTYAVRGKIDLLISAFFILGGIGGGWLGARKASSLPTKTLTQLFSIIIAIVAFYMLYMNFHFI